MRRRARNTAAQAEQLAPFLKSILRSGATGGGGSGGGEVTDAHDLGGALHTGTLRNDQAPWAVTNTAFQAHGNTPNAHLSLATNSGLTTSGTALTLGTPSQISASTNNSVSGSGHTHDIASTSNGNINHNWILESSSNGGVELSFLRAPLLTTSSGSITIQPAGDLIIDPAGNDAYPNTNYDVNLGLINKKWLTLHAAELWVETLVAQDTIATIGGRILVGPTTTLIADLGSGDSTVDVKHNQMTSGDRVYMESNGFIEFMAITSGPTTITGGYRYSVTRNLDGTGANIWYAGDAMFNTGTTGNGWIDLYSLYGVPRAGQTSTQRAGPTIVGNVRLSSTFNDFRERWAIGSLNGLYDYSGEVYGMAAGNPATAWIGADATNGVRLMQGSTELIRLAVNGDSYFAGVMTIGTGGGIYQGTGTFGSPTTGLKIWRDSGIGRIGGYNSGTAQWYADTNGRLLAGGGNVILDADGISLINQTSDTAFNETSSLTVVRSNGTLVGRVTGYYLSGGDDYGFFAMGESPDDEKVEATFGARRAGIVYAGFAPGWPRVVAESDSGVETLHLIANDINLFTDSGYQAGTFSQTGYVVLQIEGVPYKFMVAPE